MIAIMDRESDDKHLYKTYLKQLLFNLKNNLTKGAMENWGLSIFQGFF